MESKDEKDYEQYEWIYYFFDGYDVTSFNNEIYDENGNNILINFPKQLNIKKKDKKINTLIDTNEDNNKIISEENIKELNFNNNANLVRSLNLSSRSLPRNNGEISFVTKSFNQFSSRESPLDRSLIKAKSKEVLSKNSLMDSEKFENNELTNFKYFGANNKNKENKESNMIKNVADLLFDNKNNLEKNSNEIENDEDWENSKKLVEELFENNNNNFKINPYSDINNNKDNTNKDNKNNLNNKNIETNLEKDED